MLGANTAIVIGNGSLRSDDIALWLADSLSPSAPEAEHAAKLLGALLQRQIMIPFTEGRLDVGAQQSILFVELEGVRSGPIVVKILGE